VQFHVGIVPHGPALHAVHSHRKSSEYEQNKPSVGHAPVRMLVLQPVPLSGVQFGFVIAQPMSLQRAIVRH
jgi:hypothetical protein